MTRRRYANPPIDEALCELRLSPSVKWDLETPALLHRAFGDAYPSEPADQVEGNLEVLTEHEHPIVRWRPGRRSLQFTTEDETRSVRISQDVVSIHVLAPYEGWERFRDRIQDAISRYTEALGVPSLARAGIRYINRIEIPLDTVSLGDYFSVPPSLPAEIDSSLYNVFSKIEGRYNDAPIRIITTFASEQATESSAPSFILDLDVIHEWKEPTKASEGQLMPIIEELRTRERKAFEASIKDAARELFDAD